MLISYPKSQKLSDSTVADWGAQESAGRILHPLAAQVSLQHATIQPDEAFYKDRAVKKDQQEGLEHLCALNAGCFVHCGSAIKRLLLCRCRRTSPALQPRTACTGDFHERDVETQSSPFQQALPILINLWRAPSLTCREDGPPATFVSQRRSSERDPGSANTWLHLAFQLTFQKPHDKRL